MQDATDGEEPILAGTAREEVRSVGGILFNFSTYDVNLAMVLGRNE